MVTLMLLAYYFFKVLVVHQALSTRCRLLRTIASRKLKEVYVHGGGFRTNVRTFCDSSGAALFTAHSHRGMQFSSVYFLCDKIFLQDYAFAPKTARTSGFPLLSARASCFTFLIFHEKLRFVSYSSAYVPSGVRARCSMQDLMV